MQASDPLKKAQRFTERIYSLFLQMRAANKNTCVQKARTRGIYKAVRSKASGREAALPLSRRNKLARNRKDSKKKMLAINKEL